MITADFSSTSAHTVNASAPLWQYDYGQTLEIVGLDLPAASEVHFGIEGDDSAAVTEIAVSSDGVATCAIPDSILAEGSVHDYAVFAYVYVVEDSAGTTLKRVRIFVKARPLGDTGVATDGTILSDLQDSVDALVEKVNAVIDAGTEATKESLGLENVDNTADADKSVASAATLTTARAIDGVNFDGSAGIIHYGTCSVAGATAAKTVSVSNFTLVTGARVLVRFSYTNTASSPTLNVSGTGAKAIRYRNAAVPTGYIRQYGVYEFVYSGTYWYLVGDMTYALGSALSRTTLWTGLSQTAEVTDFVVNEDGFYMIEGIFSSDGETPTHDKALGTQIYLLKATNSTSYTASKYTAIGTTITDTIKVTGTNTTATFTSTTTSSTQTTQFYFTGIYQVAAASL